MDDVVAPLNAVQVVRQYLALNGHPAARAGSADALPPPDRSNVQTVSPGRTLTTSEWTVDGRLVARHLHVDTLGHAWSGGDETYPFNDATPPDATALLGAFIRDAVQ